jgi:hypothetical protein
MPVSDPSMPLERRLSVLGGRKSGAMGSGQSARIAYSLSSSACISRGKHPGLLLGAGTLTSRFTVRANSNPRQEIFQGQGPSFRRTDRRAV